MLEQISRPGWQERGHLAEILAAPGPRDGPPHNVGTFIADLVAGLIAAQGILAALCAAKIDGRGQRVHVSMYEAVAALVTFNASIYFATGNAPRR
jgi:formyl-CoA transferase